MANAPSFKTTKLQNVVVLIWQGCCNQIRWPEAQALKCYSHYYLARLSHAPEGSLDRRKSLFERSSTLLSEEGSRHQGDRSCCRISL